VKISLDWLADYVTWEDEPDALAVKLTAAGLNVESIERIEHTFPGVVVAKVLHREQHPNADRLSLCRVDDGSGETLQVVCGAPNVREGLTVLLARVGAVLPGGITLKKSKIRGVESQGMICSSTELGLGTDGSGIMELDAELAAGTPADELYGFSDTVLDIEVTPNRPDWLSHVGVAREVAAIYGTKMAMPPAWSGQQTSENLGMKVKVEDWCDCPRYMAFGATGVEVGPSPRWMQNRLRAVGSRPISNAVDITNYVMLELGQPMHAFDRGKLSGGTITVRRAEGDTSVVTLDDIERKVEPDTLLICDERGPVALAGVMGLANSEVGEATTDILLESAFFDPMKVRKASRGMGLISESSYRFERGADWDMVEKAAHRALYLFQELAGARIVPDWTDRHDPDRKAPAAIPLRLWQLNRVLGIGISTDEAAQLLQSLGLKVQPMGNPSASSANAVNIMVEPPSFRRDLHGEIDLVEEIARRYGYDNLEAGEDGYRVPGGAVRRPWDVALGRTREWLSACGFHEMVTSSFQRPGEADRLGLAADDMRREALTVINPRHGGDTGLRTCLLPSLLHVARHNLNSGAEAPLRLFQVNRAFWPAGCKPEQPRHADEVLLPEEPRFLQIGIAGWRETGLGGVPRDLLELRGTIESLAGHLRVELSLEPADVEVWFETGAQWAVLDGKGRRVGSAGRVSRAVAEAHDLDQPLAAAEINLDLLDLEAAPIRFEPFARFPAVKRDLSLLVPAGVSYGQIAEVVRESAGPLLAGVELFDIYRGKGLPEGRGAYGIRLKFRSAKGNLKGKTVDLAIGAALEALAARLGIEPRTQD
jgi:phenylalanyl-tRNA synthetase beta chain